MTLGSLRSSSSTPRTSKVRRIFCSLAFVVDHAVAILALFSFFLCVHPCIGDVRIVPRVYGSILIHILALLCIASFIPRPCQTLQKEGHLQHSDLVRPPRQSQRRIGFQMLWWWWTRRTSWGAGMVPRRYDGNVIIIVVVLSPDHPQHRIQHGGEVVAVIIIMMMMIHHDRQHGFGRASLHDNSGSRWWFPQLTVDVDTFPHVFHPYYRPHRNVHLEQHRMLFALVVVVAVAVWSSSVVETTATPDLPPHHRSGVGDRDCDWDGSSSSSSCCNTADFKRLGIPVLLVLPRFVVIFVIAVTVR